jgi:origin recognition complex subunit 4
MRHFDEAFGDPFGGDEGVSTEVFRANESLRKQREARNFRYEGDADAPKLTRSGKIVRRREVAVDAEEQDGDGDGNGDEADAYGAGAGEGEDDDMLGVNGEERPDIDMDVEIPAPVVDIPSAGHPAYATPDTPAPPDPGAVKPLLPAARQHILRILSTLTGSGIARDPSPFADEDTNEALQGLVNLLKGTVERGEGNSAMLVGPRGTGKTRVS